jgi:hypothetical protein
MVRQMVADSGRTDRIAEYRTPFAVAFVGSENEAAALVTGADALKENRGFEIVQIR